MAQEEDRTTWRRQIKRLAVLAGITTLCFSLPLFDLARFCLHSKNSEFYSYIPLIPLITGYLIWLRRDRLRTNARPSWVAAAVAAAAGGALLAFYALSLSISADADYLCIMTLAFLLMLLAAGFATVGVSTIASIAFPLALLLFLIPYPGAIYEGIEYFFQHTSAAMAHGFFSMAGTSCDQDGLIMALPTKFSLQVAPKLLAANPGSQILPTIFSLEVAPECSGIHSSQVLLITSLLAGYLFLRSPWRRVVLTLFVIPLAIVRNGFRIFVIGELCAHVSPFMIDSWIHHQGGPVFFALSLVPFFLFLIWLRKSESKTQNTVKALDKP